MKTKRIAALLLSGILLCADCSSALAMTGSNVSDIIRDTQPLLYAEDGKASPSDAGEEPDRAWDIKEWADRDLPDTDEIWLEDGQATPSDAEEELENDLIATPSNAKGNEARFYYQESLGDVTVTIEAEAGVLPAGTSVTIDRIEYAGDKPIRELVEETPVYAEREIGQVAAFDITLWYKGEEIEPEDGSVTVTFESSAMSEAAGSGVFHLETDTQRIQTLEAASQHGESITFETDHFSVYGFVVLAEGKEAWNAVKEMKLYPTTDAGSRGILSEQSGKINVLLFGRAGSCANTMKAADSMEALLTEEAAEKINVYLLDIDQPRNDVVQYADQAGWNYIDACSSPDNRRYYANFMFSLVDKTIQPGGGTVMLPAVFIFDRNQTVRMSETGPVSQDQLAELLLEIDHTLNLNTYVSTDDLYLINKAAYQENRSDQEALAYYGFYDAQAYPEVYEKAVAITAGCSSDMEKLHAIYGWVTENVCYDRDSFKNGGGGVTEPSDILNMNPMRCVCQGYANLTRDLCRAAGIPCKTVSGYALGVGAESYWTEAIRDGNESNHAWNEAFIDGTWVILDPTWDSENIYENGEASYAPAREQYFDISLREFSSDHKIVAAEAVGSVRITNLRAAQNIGGIRLEWDTDGEPDYHGRFAVYRKSGGGDYVRLDLTQRKYYLDTSVNTEMQLYYKVTYLADNGYESEGQGIEVWAQNPELEISIPTSDRMYIGQNKKLEVSFNPPVTTTPEISWTSSNEEVVKVSRDGVVTGVSYGGAYITAQCGSKSSTCWIFVIDMKEVKDPRVTDNYSGYIRLEWNTQGWQSSVIERRVTENGDYEVLDQYAEESFVDRTAVPGTSYTYRICNKSGDMVTDGVEVEVKASALEVRLPQRIILKSENSRKLAPEYIGFEEQFPAMTWSSSNPDVAKVDGQGNVTAVSEGKADIILTADAGHYQVATEVLCAAADYDGYCTGTERKVIELVNKERMAEGRSPVSFTDQMQQAAHIRKAEVKSFYSHTRPDGTTCFSVFNEVGVSAYGAGENIAQGQTTPSAVMNAWMNSTGHRRNILDSDFSHMGAGEVSRSWVQMFAGCPGTKTYALLLPKEPLTVSKGTAVENLGIVVLAYCDYDGMGYIPLIDAMCSGYDKNTAGDQVVTVAFDGYTESFPVTVNKSSGGSSGSGGGGGGSSSGGGGGGGSTFGGASIAGGAAIGGPGAGQTAAVPKQITTLPEHVTGGNWEPAGTGWRLRKPDGTYAANQWAFINGKWYLMGADSYMVTGWQQANNIWYYFNGDGSMAVGWVLVGGKWYYLAEAGNMVSGWILLDYRWYYLNPDGSMATGVITVDGKSYIMGEDGALRE